MASFVAAVVLAAVLPGVPAAAQTTACAGLPGIDDRCETWTAIYDDPSVAVGSYQLEPRVAASADGSRLFMSAINQHKNLADPSCSPASWTVLGYEGLTGAELWQQSFRGPGNYDRPNAITASRDGSIVVATGGSYDAPVLCATDRDLITIAYDGITGRELWRAHSDGPIGDVGTEVLLSADEQQVFVVVNVRNGGGDIDWAVAAYDMATGEELWRTPYAGLGLAKVDSPKAAALSPAGDLLYVTGESGGAAQFDADYATVAYATIGPAAGSLVWEARFDGGKELSDRASDLAVDRDGRVIVTGDTLLNNRSGNVDLDYMTVAYDGATGEQLWKTSYAGPVERGFDFGRTLATSPLEHVAIVSGQSDGGGRDYDWGTVAYDTRTGAELWSRRLSTPNYKTEFANDIAVSPDGTTALVTGVSGGTNVTNYRDLNRSYGNTVAYALDDGALEWSARVTGDDETDSFSPRGVVVAADGSAFTAGQLTNNMQTDESDNLYDAMLVAYRTTSGPPTPTPTSSATPLPSPTRAAVAWRNLDKRIHPPGSFAGSMVYDEARSEILLFGGATTGVDPVGTWLNDGTGWRRAPVSSEPAGRYGATMAYDAASERTILFGGYVYDEAAGRNRPVDETWAWDGQSWTELSPANSPPARAFASAAYDQVGGEIVLFGGVGPDASGALEELGDTWTFDGSTWTQEATPSAPSRRHSPGMAFHEGSGVVLFGGWGPGTGVPCTTTAAGICFKLDPSARSDDGIKADTWTWKDGGWTEVATSRSPQKRGGMGMVYDPLSHRTVLFGGVNFGGSFDDTWAFDGTDWVEITPAESPERRFDPMMAADPHRGLVLFGGHRSTYMGSDTWIFAEGVWSSADVPTPKPRFGPSLVYDDARGRIVMFGGDADQVFSDTWVYRDAWERLQPEVSPPGRAQAGEAFDSARGEFVVFGGQGHQGEDLGDTWTFEGTTWTEHTSTLPDLSPLARRGPAMVYDPVRDESVMFGGWNVDVGVFADTWTWDGSAWTPKVPITSPPAVESAAMTFDPQRKQVVLFGGIDETNKLRDETWLWDGASWTKADPATVPPGRTAAAMAYVPELGAVAMMGGIGGDAGVWLWDGTDWEHIEIPDGPAKRSWAGFTYGGEVGGAFLFGGVARGYRSDTWLLGRAPSPSPSPSLSPQPEDTTLALTDRSANSGQYSDETSFEARLTNSDGDPISDAEVVFELAGAGSSRSFAVDTDQNGIARVTPTLEETPGTYQLTVRYAGDDDLVGSADTSTYIVEKEDTDLELRVEGSGNKRALTAHLMDRDTPSAGIEGRTVHFYADGELIGSATTDGNGVATVNVPPRYRGGKRDFEARFTGDDHYRSSIVHSNE